jgi:HEAT repeat protein
MGSLSAAQLRALVKSDEDSDDELVRRFVRQPDASAVLAELANDRDPEVRFWVASVAAEGLKREDARPILLKLARDRDPDVRDGALEMLIEHDPEAARAFLPAFRRQLHSRERFEPVGAIWSLAALGDAASLPEIQRVAAVSDSVWVRNSARIVSLLLTGREEEIVAAIDAHDEEWMPYYAEAARLLGTAAARSALERCAQRPGDEFCQIHCGEALSNWRPAKKTQQLQ